MNKFKRKLVGDIKKELAQEKEQEKLQEKYKVDPDVLIVEKSNMAKFLLRSIGRIIQTSAVITLLIFAAIGILSLVYSETREGLYKM